jgi:hypothetical protein
VLGELDQRVAEHQHHENADHICQRRRDTGQRHDELGEEQGRDGRGDVGDRLHGDADQAEGVLPQVGPEHRWPAAWFLRCAGGVLFSHGRPPNHSGDIGGSGAACRTLAR